LIWCSDAAPNGACEGGYIGKALEYVGQKGLTTEKCNPYGHGGGSNTLGYSGCPTTCKGSGNINNKVKPVGYSDLSTCVDSTATDGYGDGCATYNANTHWCGL